MLIVYVKAQLWEEKNLFLLKVSKIQTPSLPTLRELNTKKIEINSKI